MSETDKYIKYYKKNKISFVPKNTQGYPKNINNGLSVEKNVEKSVFPHNIPFFIIY